MKSNQDYVMQQMKEKKNRDFDSKEYEKNYFKPHFGPEETLVGISQKLSDEAQKKRMMNEMLRHQINCNREESETSKQEDRERDLQFLNAAANTQYVENMALRRKEEALK